MFERYTETARQVIVSSKHKASHVASSNIEVEHLLLGLLATDKGLARRFLGSPWAAEAIWKRIEKDKPSLEQIPGPVDVPLSNQCTRALSYGAEEADKLSNKHIGTEHLFLGILRDEQGFAARILPEDGVRLASTREELVRIPRNDSST